MLAAGRQDDDSKVSTGIGPSMSTPGGLSSGLAEEVQPKAVASLHPAPTSRKLPRRRPPQTLARHPSRVFVSKIEREIIRREEMQIEIDEAYGKLKPYLNVFLQQQIDFLILLCVAVDSLNPQRPTEKTLIDDMKELMDELAAEYGKELAKHDKKDNEYIAYLKDVAEKGTEMIHKLKEFGATVELKTEKITAFVNAVQAKRRQFYNKLGRILEILAFVVLGAFVGALLGYALGHFFFVYFTHAATSLGLSTGASAGLALGQSGLGVGGLATANLTYWARYSFFYKETPAERIGKKVEIAANNVAHRSASTLG